MANSRHHHHDISNMAKTTLLPSSILLPVLLLQVGVGCCGANQRLGVLLRWQKVSYRQFTKGLSFLYTNVFHHCLQVVTVPLLFPATQVVACSEEIIVVDVVFVLVVLVVFLVFVVFVVLNLFFGAQLLPLLV